MASISESLIQWYLLNKRDLPWRNTQNPYFIWLSETILQQTRVSQGMAYYFRFIERFPRIEDLANAQIDEVLEIWQGLGYYSRARNLHFTSKVIANQFSGRFPSTFESLLKLKGVGRYTAAAIASFAFHEDKGVVDGNVIRVVCRLFQIPDDIRSQKTRYIIDGIVNQILPRGEAYFFNQSIMELGALVCLPRNPTCHSCPVKEFCGAFQTSSQSRFPFKSAAKAKKVRYLNYLFIEKEGLFYFQKRGKKDIWEELYEPWLVESQVPVTSPDFIIEHALKNEFFKVENFSFTRWFSPRKHILSHQELWVSLCHIQVKDSQGLLNGKWVLNTEINALPKPVIISKILKENVLSELPLVPHLK